MAPPQDLRQLTALRFVAALWVVLYLFWPRLAVSDTPALIAHGYLGVELFFILSGFILSHVYGDEVRSGAFRYLRFLGARIARIYPLHLATLAGMGLLVAAAAIVGVEADPSILSWASLPANLLLMQAWGLAPVAGWNHPSWSVSAEWFAYLTFPLFMSVMLPGARRPFTTLALTVAFMFGVYAGFERLSGESLTSATISWGALRIVPCFAYGCALHILWRAHPGGPAGSEVWLAAAAALCVVILASLDVHDSVIILGEGALIYALARLANSQSQAFGNHAAVYLGEISYAVYMVCAPCQIVFVNTAARLLEVNHESLPIWPWILCLVLIIPVAAAAHHLIEKPARAQIRGWTDSWSTQRRTVA